MSNAYFFGFCWIVVPKWNCAMAMRLRFANVFLSSFLPRIVYVVSVCACVLHVSLRLCLCWVYFFALNVIFCWNGLRDIRPVWPDWNQTLTSFAIVCTLHSSGHIQIHLYISMCLPNVHFLCVFIFVIFYLFSAVSGFERCFFVTTHT